MKNVVRWIAITLLVLTLGSCGIPGSIVRSGSRAVQGANSMMSGS